MPQARRRSSGKPPDRDGLSASVVALPQGDWSTVLDFLCDRFPAVSAGEWISRMAVGDVIDAHGLPLEPNAPYHATERVFYFRRVADEPVIPFLETVLFQDDWLVVADKPHFLPVTPGGKFVHETLLVRLKQKLGIPTLAPMHRIDRDTAGLVLFTVQPASRDAYQRLFRERRVEKTYEALAPWRSDLPLPLTRQSRLIESSAFMQMMEVAGEPNAETTLDLIDMIDPSERIGRYRLHPHTGQKHQLRAHMAALGIPILNDRLYPTLLPERADLGFERPLQLLAKSIRFVDPMTGKARFFESGRTLAG